MNRREFIAGLGGTAAAWSLAARAQPRDRPLRVGFIGTGAAGRYATAFREGMEALGYIEGRTLTIDYRFAHGQFDRLPVLAAELVALRVDIIVCSGGPAVLAAKRATATIPIVMGGIADPVREGAVSSLARPDGNVTGVARSAAPITGKHVELLKELCPTATRLVAFWHDTSSGYTQGHVAEAEKAAAWAGLRIDFVEMRDRDDIGPAFARAVALQPHAVIVQHDGLTLPNMPQILAEVVRHRFPAIYSTREWSEAGGLISYGADFLELYRVAAVYVDKIAKGAKPGDLPVQLPTKFELVINLKTAKALGLVVPPTMLARADEVIE